MTQEIINQYFRSELGSQCDSLFSTSDDRVFIRREEAELHTMGKLDIYTVPLEDKKIVEWYSLEEDDYRNNPDYESRNKPQELQ